MRIALLSLALIAYLVGSAGAQNYFEGDLNEDYKVDFADLHVLAGYWLDVSCVAPDCEADMDGVPGVNMFDFASFATNWLKDYNDITLTINVNGNGSVNSIPNKDTYHYGEVVNLTSNPATGWLLGPPEDDFNDEKQSTIWRTSGNNPERTMVVEDANRLNLTATNEMTDVASYALGCWKMNDNAANTNVLDSSENGHDGTFNDATGDPNTSAHHTAGKIDGALTFDGTNDYISVPDDASLDITGPLTLISWIKYTSTGSGWIISKGKTGTANGYWAGINTGKVRFGNNAGFKTTNSAFNDGNWHFVACVYSGVGNFSALKIYVDNVEQATTETGSFSGFSATSEPLVFGARTSDSVVSGFLTGSIDNAMVFNKALTAEERRILYGEKALFSFCSGHWKMNDNTADTNVLDSSDGHNGTFNDATGNPNTSAHHIVGKIDGALTFDGTDDYVFIPDDAGLDIPGALSLAFWTKYTSTGSSWIISKGKTGTAYGYWAGIGTGKVRFGNNAGFKTTNSAFNDGIWHFVVCVYDGGGTFGALKIYVDNVEQAATQTGNFSGFSATGEPLVFGARTNDSVVSGFLNGSIDNAMLFNKALTAEERGILYNEGNGTETIPAGSNDYGSAFYVANGWNFDVNESFAVKIDFHYSDISGRNGRVGITVADNNNYVSISAGSDGNQAYYYYETVIDNNTVLEQELRDTNDGTLYISYDGNLHSLYLSPAGYGSENAYVWQTISSPLQVQWASPLDVAIGGNSDGVALDTGEAYLDNFEVTSMQLLGWQFSSWSGDLGGSDNPTTITMNGNKTVTAAFTQIEYTLTTNVNGSGSVTREPNKAIYHFGEDINLTAHPATGWQLSSWSGDLGGSDNPATIIMNGNKTVTATFAQEQYTLMVNIIGNGTVTKVPQQATYTYGADVNLTANPAAGWAFDSWSGDLSGSENQKTITMTDNKIVTAAFTQIGYTLVINEFMAKNNSDSGIRDEWGDYDDWIEIYNYGSEAVNIAGMHLTDKPVNNPLPWWDVPTNDPAATIIPAGGFLLIWADGQQEQGTLHASFALSGSGEQIGLFDADGNLIDSITFGPQEQNKSYGRLLDGSDDWQILDNPTPAKSNGVPPSGIIISEIMYHPYHNVLTYEPENLGQEYIELFNRGTASVDLSGWRFSNGVDFNFPDVTIPAGQCLVVAADVNTFKAKYPSVNNVVGGWTGKLRNKGEKIELADEHGMIIDTVRYADEGDWAVRMLGPIDNYHRGWEWSDAHDGAGKSLELINPAMLNEHGQNWAASNVNEGTPGAINSVNSNNIAPLILDVEHSPIIPGPNDPVSVTARIIDELPTGISATLYYSVDNSVYTSESVYPHFNPDDYNSLPMFDDGAHGDGAASDGIYGAQIPAHANGIIIEFFVKVQDAGSNSRTWPPASLIDGTPEQVTNVLYQVNASFDPNAEWIAGARPIFYLIMTEMERGRLEDIGDEQPGDNYEKHSQAQMNGTFISIDGVDMKKRYTVSIRNRGESTGGVLPNNFRVNFRHDDPWKDITAINLNSTYTYLQVAGSVIFRMAGMLASEASPIDIRVNGTNLALMEPSKRYGAYAYVEAYDSDWAENHIPDDSGGNIYKAAHYPATATLDYLGTNPADYENAGYSKLTNESENNWTDLFDLTNVLDNEPDITYVEEVNRVLDVKQWLRWFAANALIGNNETGLGTGVGDDYRLYRGLVDTRFQLLIHDLDTILYVGESIPPTNRSIFYAADTGSLPVINRFLKHPVFVRQYFAELVDLIETTFSAEQFNPLLDQLLAGWVPQSMLNEMKLKMAERAANVMQQIPLTFSVSSSLPISNGYPRTTTSSTSLYGKANAIETASVLVNGQLANWTPVDGNWTIGSTITLKPGINRVIVQTFDEPNGTGNEMEQGYIDIWYDDGSTSTISGTLATSRTLDAASGPWNVTGDVVVPSGITLTIQPGTTLYFNSGTGITVNAGGRLVAEGTQYQRIRMTRTPGTTITWDGLKFNSTLEDNRLAYVDQEYGAGQGQAINALYSRLIIDNMSWAGITNSFIYMEHPYTTISNNYFPTLSSGEPVHGIELTGNEYLILQGNVFAEGGVEDILDWDGTDSNKISFFAFDNIFLGGGDDGLDLDATDAYIEGNIFMNFHCADPCTTTSNCIAGGKSYHTNTNLPDWTIVRNIFVSNDHGILAKEGAFATVLNNVFVDSNDTAIQFCEKGRNVSGPGSGAYIVGSIFWKYIRPFKYLIWESDLDPETGWPADPNVTVNNSIITDQNYLGSDNLLGSGNINANPLFVDELSDFHLKYLSPAIGTGPCGLDMGLYVPSGAAICGEPDEITYHTDAAITVGGPAITHYKYQLEDNNSLSGWSGEFDVNTLIVLTGLQNGHSYMVYAAGKNCLGLWQTDPCYVTSRTWTIDTSYSRLVINEVLAHTHGSEPDLIELYYDGPASIDLTDMSLTDDPCLPRKFVFSTQTVTTVIMNPGDYMVLYGDLQTQQNHLGFALSADGEGLYLYDKTANGGGLIDSVVFGPQINDYSIGRIGYGGLWKLNKLTMGQANIAQPLGDPSILKINEWLADAKVLFTEDFIELYNPQLLPVDLSDLYLTDNSVTQPAKQKLGPLSFIPPDGFAVFVADDVNAPGHLDFKLSVDREFIGLFDAELKEIDKVIYCAQTTDVSQGRSPDGADNFEFFELPTPHIANPAIITTIIDKTLVAGNAAKRAKVPTVAISDNWRGGGTFDDSDWTLVTGSPGGIGYDRATGSGGNYIPYISYNVESLMYGTGKNTTCYIRIPFTVDANDINDITAMTLNMRYDDGFVAYINGTEVHRKYFTGAPVWNSKANTDRTTDCSTPESFDISGYTNTLQAGNNILAIHGLNYSTTNNDFLITAELVATIAEVNEVFPYPDALELLDGLRITELMYHAPEGSSYDYIELYNISDTTLHLDGTRFIEGIDFTFPNITLDPGQHIVVVSNIAAFQSKYGYSSNIAGEYAGNLDNGGEDIILQLPWPCEAAILRFEYDDSWYPSTDGLGDSLVIRDPNAHQAAWDKAESWQAAPPSP